ncbi:MAG: 16S rRNA (guanine(966)-N(2))-methyltransferase RsmD [Clostridia bacterium]|nr:16S rRNA (guanine(966)-N(2))-methyltransferase RsmD [Clostridia bacterium]
MRIIAGEMRSRKLKTPEGLDTRPTADRVKEALFSILQNRLYGARVLDLYGGSGALALEALSRGAQSAVINDQAPRACRVIRENIAALGWQARVTLLQMKDASAIDALEKAGDRFDLIFLDPPYKLDTAAVCERLEKRLLAPDGLIVVEHARETPPQAGASLTLRDRREYGITGLSFYRRAGEDEG